MKLTKYTVNLLIFQVIMKTCVSEFTVNPLKSKDSSDHVDAAVINVLKSCYWSQVNTIGLAGNIPDSLIATLSSEKPVVIIHNATRSVDGEPVSHLNRNKLLIFVITASSSTELEGILVKIKKSRWWNHMAYFYMLDWPMKKYGCSEAYAFLWTAWKKNLLEAKFMCTHRTKGELIYAFNPYTADAPEPWQLETTHRGENDHPWTLLVREYREDRKLCKNMDFDKTKDLGGYAIHAAVMIKRVIMFRVNEKVAKPDYRSIKHGHLPSLISSLNATFKLLTYSTEHGGFVDGNDIPPSIIETVNGKRQWDIELISRNLLDVSNLTLAYPHEQRDLRVVAHYRGDKSQLSKFAAVFDVKSRIGLILVCLLTIIFLKYIIRQSAATAILNMIRMICNASLTHLPGNVPSRIYLASLLMFVVTIQGIYQGKWASILAKRVPLKNINTMEDLAEFNCTIYVPSNYLVYFDDPVFDGRKVDIKNSLYFNDSVLQDSSAALAGSKIALIRTAARLKLHMSEDNIAMVYRSMLLREDWPLEQRFNVNLQRLVEAYVVEQAIREYNAPELYTYKANENENKDRGCKILALNDLSFAFAILGIGLGSAVICFTGEMAIRRIRRTSIAKIRQRFRD